MRNCVIFGVKNSMNELISILVQVGEPVATESSKKSVSEISCDLTLINEDSDAICETWKKLNNVDGFV